MKFKKVPEIKVIKDFEATAKCEECKETSKQTFFLSSYENKQMLLCGNCWDDLWEKEIIGKMTLFAKAILQDIKVDEGELSVDFYKENLKLVEAFNEIVLNNQED